MRGRNEIIKRFLASVTLAIFMANMFPPARAEAAGPGPMAELKLNVGQEDVDEVLSSARKSNVLFMIEATAAMSFSPKGVLPQVVMVNCWDDSYFEGGDWRKTKAQFGYRPEDINRMTADATFGMGALPPAWSGQDIRAERNLYGRDIISGNNFIRTGLGVSADIEANRDRYYFPHLGATNAINNDSYGHGGSGSGIYRSQNTALEIGFENAPNIFPNARGIAENPGRNYPGFHRATYLGHWDGAVYNMPYFYHTSKKNASDRGFYRSLPLNPVTGAPTTAETSTTRNNRLYHTIGLGDQVVADYNYKSNTNSSGAFPYAMVFKNPAHWRTPPSSFTDADLVPNDSRMYQTKLVLWRLLQNRDLFKNMRIGLASTFLSPANAELGKMLGTHYGVWTQRQDYNGIFKVAPFGSNIHTIGIFDSAGNMHVNNTANVNSMMNSDGSFKPGYRRVKLENGVLYSALSGNMETYAAHFGQYYPLWQSSKVSSYYEVPRKRPVPTSASGTTGANLGIAFEEPGWFSEGWVKEGGAAGDLISGENRDRPLYKLYNRGSLWVPILDYDHVWKTRDNAYSITQADKIRLWIDGVADIRSAGPTATSYTTWKDDFGVLSNGALDVTARNKQFHYYRNPELGISTAFALPQAIFPDPRANHPSKPNVKLELDRAFYYGYGSKWNGGQALGRKRQVTGTTAQSDAFDNNKNHFVWFSKKDKHINYRADYRRYSQELDYSGIPRAFFTAGSGEAAGSVLDFFSPKYKFEFTGKASTAHSWANTHATTHTDDGVQIYDSSSGQTVKMDDLADVSFPIRNECENNWVIVVASGTEPKSPTTADGHPGYTYELWEAVNNLYKATNKATSNDVPFYERSTMMYFNDSGARQFKMVDLDDPIRTLVVGIVANPSDPEISGDPEILKKVKDMRLNLTRAAMSGQGYGAQAAALTVDNMHTAPVQPYFADDVQSLMKGIEDALSYIEQHSPQPAKGAMVEAPTLSDKLTEEGSNNREFDYYSANFLIHKDRQWDGFLTRYSVVEEYDPITKTYSLVAMRRWELNSKILAKRGGGAYNGSWRALRYWNGGTLATLQNDASFAAMSGLAGANMYGVTGFAAGEGFYDPLSSRPAHSAMYDWLQGYDHSYGPSAGQNSWLKRKNLLGDIGQGGVAFVNDPSRGPDSLPGYSAWADGVAAASQDARIYVQTNDGILHVVDPSSGDEKLAILPPPSLLPARLATIKTNRRGDAGNEKLEWINVRVGENEIEEGDVTVQRGNPVYILDGSLQKRYFAKTPAGSSWGKFVLGALGRGGSGLYMMDADQIENPKLLWYRERIGTKIMQEAESGGSPIEKGTLTDGDAYFLKLGFNSPKPVMGVAARTTAPYDDMRNFIVMAGGAQHELKPNDNGKDGAVLVILDPHTGEVISGFDSASLSSSGLKSGGDVTGAAPYMGMMVSEPTLQRSYVNSAFSGSMTGHIYAADNRGNIFHVGLEKPDADGNIVPLSPGSWRIETLATLQTTSSASSSAANYAIPFGVIPYKNVADTWLAGGTSNLFTKKSDGDDGRIANASQMIFSFQTKPGEQTSVRTRSSLQDMKATKDGDPEYNAGSHHGWRIPLALDKITNGRITEYAEYVSAKSIISGGVLFIPTFVAKGFSESELNDPAVFCAGNARAKGTARLYALNVIDGKRWEDGDRSFDWHSSQSKFIEIKNAKITGLSISRGGSVSRGIVTVDKLGDMEADDNFSTLVENENDAILTFKLPPSGGGTSMKPGQNFIKYWISQ
jgi:hypothetical protein